MANPQKENGHIEFANDLFDAIIRTRIPGEARQCFDFIVRKTYGWNKKKDFISLSQFVENTGIIKSHVCRVLKKLQQMNMITITQKGNGVSEYAIQKDFEKWEPLPKKVTLPKKVIGVTQKGNAVKSEKTNEKFDHESDCKQEIGKSSVTQKGTHKRHKSRDTITKDKAELFSPSKKEIEVVDYYYDGLSFQQKVRYEKNREKYFKTARKLLKGTKAEKPFTIEEIKIAIDFARNSDFWSSKFLGFDYLWKKNSIGYLYIEVFLHNVETERKQKNPNRTSTQKVSSAEESLEQLDMLIKEGKIGQ